MALLSSLITLNGVATLTGSQTLTNKTLVGVNLTGATTFSGSSGANTQFLTSNGPGNAPTWQNPPAFSIFGNNASISQLHAIAISM
jgi:hypothetical protein